jgi:hypothetical protein
MSEGHSTDRTSRGRGRSRYFREPSHHWWWALGIVLSIWAIYYGLTADPPGSQSPALFTLRFLCLGAGGLSTSVAEFLPRDRIALAGRLRIAGYALFWVFIGLFLLDIVLNVVISSN